MIVVVMGGGERILFCYYYYAVIGVCYIGDRGESAALDISIFPNQCRKYPSTSL